MVINQEISIYFTYNTYSYSYLMKNIVIIFKILINNYNFLNIYIYIIIKVYKHFSLSISYHEATEYEPPIEIFPAFVRELKLALFFFYELVVVKLCS